MDGPTALERAAGEQISVASGAAAMTFLVYDILLSFDEEVRFIWTKRWNLVKCVYFFIRYFPLLVQISIIFIGTELTPQFHFTSHDCFIWEVYQGVATIGCTAAVDYILLLRVFALYFENKTMRYLLGILYALEILGMSLGLAFAAPGFRYDDICLTTLVPRSMLLYGAATGLFQVLLFVLTLYRFAGRLRRGRNHHDGVASLLMRDGTWAFFLLFSFTVSQGSVYLVKNKAVVGLFYGWCLTCYSFVGYRVLLNIHKLSVAPGSASPRTRRHEFTSVMPGVPPFSSGAPPDSYSAYSYELSDLSSPAATTLSTGRNDDHSVIPPHRKDQA
ncbi:hypothetical protein C8J56DRAFT_369732 [Mycena floridula]|nr:hypothetical protein C8J56DRAFT_369732 [Mycena floridula]